LTKYTQIAVVRIINVRAAQVQDARRKLIKRGAHLVIGKNSVIRKAIELRANELPKDEEYDWAREMGGAPNEKLKALLPILKDKIAFVFSNSPVAELKPLIEENRIAAGAKAGTISNINFTIPPGPTGMDPSQIGFFHALSISTKIVKGQIEITKDYNVCTIGKKIGNSEVVLLQKMNLKPFSYGMEVQCAYDDGNILDAAKCGISFNDVHNFFRSGVKNLTAISLETGYATELSVPHAIIDAFKNLAAIGLETNYLFDALKGAQSGPAQSSKPAETKKEAPKEEAPKEEEEDVDLGGGLFGDDDFWVKLKLNS